MKQNELRIGNWVDWDEKTIRSEVKGIHPSGNYLHLENGWVQLSRCEPIPLTEEWFVKFGAKLDDFEIDCFFISSLTCDYRFFKSTTIDNHVYWTCEKVLGNTCIEYVHQLQNLHFALTGEELELK